MNRIVVILFCTVISVIGKTQTTLLNGVTLGPGISKMLDQPGKPNTLVLTYKSKSEATEARKLLLERNFIFEGPEFIELPIQGIRATGADLDWLTKIPGAFGIWPNSRMNGELHQAIYASRVFDVRNDAFLTTLNGGLPLTGRGIGVLVNDSGFDGDSTDLQASENATSPPRRIVQNTRGQGSSWTEDQGNEGIGLDTDQGGGHGSHVMGIVGGDGRKSNGKFTGVAPGTYLIGYGSGAGLLILDTDGGFEYALRHAKDYNIRVITNSFGTTSDTTFLSFDPSNPISVASKTLVDNGIIVVFSAGNSGPGSGTITGNYKTSPWIITVANGFKTGELASSSSRGRPLNGVPANEEAMQAPIVYGGKNYLWENRPTITAPGTDIVSVRATSGPIGYTGATDDINELTPAETPFYAVLSGTSMAAPHVAGIVALMLEANPNLEWRAIKSILQRTTVPMPEKKWESGEGYVNAHAAVYAAIYGLCSSTGDYNTKYGLKPNGDFGFADDPWKTCPLIPEVSSKIQTVMPGITGIVPLCGATQPVLVDPVAPNDPNGGPTPPSSNPSFDVKEVRFVNETATAFDVVLEVAGNLAGVPGGVVGGSQNYFDVHFALDKIAGSPPEPQVVYIVSSFKNATNGDQFRLTVKSGDGTTRPNTNVLHYETITGVWNNTLNTITWTVEKSKLNVNLIPAAVGTAGSRNGRAARIGDRLKSWEAYIYNRPPGLTPDGPGVYIDKSKGQCFKELSVQ